MKKKILTVLTLGVAVLALAGCGKKAAQNNAPESQAANNQQSSAKEEANLPTPTGKVDDTVNSIVSGADKEGAQATSDDNDAKSATANDSQAVDDTGKEL